MPDPSRFRQRNYQWQESHLQVSGLVGQPADRCRLLGGPRRGRRRVNHIFGGQIQSFIGNIVKMLHALVPDDSTPKDRSNVL